MSTGRQHSAQKPSTVHNPGDDNTQQPTERFILGSQVQPLLRQGCPYIRGLQRVTRPQTSNILALQILKRALIEIAVQIGDHLKPLAPNLLRFHAFLAGPPVLVFSYKDLDGLDLPSLKAQPKPYKP